MNGTKIYELGIIKSILPPSTPYKKRYIIDWVDGEQRMQKNYSDHDIQTYKELLEIYMDGREPDRVLKVIWANTNLVTCLCSMMCSQEKTFLDNIQSHKGDRYIIQWNDGTTSSTFIQNVESYKNLLRVSLGQS